MAVCGGGGAARRRRHPHSLRRRLKETVKETASLQSKRGGLMATKKPPETPFAEKLGEEEETAASGDAWLSGRRLLMSVSAIV